MTGLPHNDVRDHTSTFETAHPSALSSWTCSWRRTTLMVRMLLYLQ